mmetsp:Transcript_21919/g.53566  ORF Transcript_21919/g.53566 Transcript_21919/m.53566 type:complete len:211 (+) Transcript_21919:690-1322(+)
MQCLNGRRNLQFGQVVSHAGRNVFTDCKFFGNFVWHDGCSAEARCVKEFARCDQDDGLEIQKQLQLFALGAKLARIQNNDDSVAQAFCHLANELATWDAQASLGAIHSMQNKHGFGVDRQLVADRFADQLVVVSAQRSVRLAWLELHHLNFLLGEALHQAHILDHSPQRRKIGKVPPTRRRSGPRAHFPRRGHNVHDRRAAHLLRPRARH